MNNIDTTLSWWRKPIGNSQFGKSIIQWTPRVIQKMSPVTLACTGSSIIGVLLCFFGITSNKKSAGIFGLIACTGGIAGFIYNYISDYIGIDKKENEPKKVKNKDQSQDNPFFTHTGLCTNAPEVLIIDACDGYLQGNIKKELNVIEGIKKLDLKKSKLLLNHKLLEVRTVTLLSLISRDDFNENEEVKKLILNRAKEDDFIIKILRELVQTEKDNKEILSRVISLLITL